MRTLIAILILATLAWAPAPNVYKLTPQHNRYEIGITCTNGGDPTVAGSFDGMLVVSCGK